MGIKGMQTKMLIGKIPSQECPVDLKFKVLLQ